jgi:hypothetical protein
MIHDERTAAVLSPVAAFPADNAMFITFAGGHTSDTNNAIHRVEASETVPAITGKQHATALAGGQIHTLCSARAADSGANECE